MYAVAKAAVHNLTRHLATDLATCDNVKMADLVIASATIPTPHPAGL